MPPAPLGDGRGSKQLPTDITTSVAATTATYADATSTIVVATITATTNTVATNIHLI